VSAAASFLVGKYVLLDLVCRAAVLLHRPLQCQLLLTGRLYGKPIQMCSAAIHVTVQQVEGGGGTVIGRAGTCRWNSPKNRKGLQ
jgi:hypothetical protein